MKFVDFLNEAERKTDISLDDAIKQIKQHCRNVDVEKPLYRGSNGKGDVYVLVGENGGRSSKNISNHYTLILDQQLKEKHLPLRSKSTIASNSKNVAGIYGETYAIFPYDDVTIGKCYNNDIWVTKVEFGDRDVTYYNFNKFLNEKISHDPKTYADIINDISKILDVDDVSKLDYAETELYSNFKKQYNDLKVMSFQDTDKKEVADKVLRHMYDLKTAKFEFGTYKELGIDNLSTDNELWFSGKCIAIKLDLYEQALKDKLFD